MLQPANHVAHLRYSQCAMRSVLLLLLTFAACQPAQPPATDPEPAPSTPPAPQPVSKPDPKPVPEEAPPPPEPLRVALLASSANPEYAAVQSAFLELAGPENVEVFELDGSAARAREAIATLRQHGHENVLAIGLLADRSTHGLDLEKVVFCQVMNHADYESPSPRRRGILPLPPMATAAELWRSVDPSVTRVGVITGEGHEALIEAARQAFAENGIELVHRVTTTDKETVFEFQRMAKEIQGYWLMPDNRILSQTALRDIMSLARRSGIGVLANNPRFLDLGAVFSVSTDPEDIAAHAFALMEEARDDASFDSEEMIWPHVSVLRVNPAIASQLGYDLSAAPQTLLAR